MRDEALSAREEAARRATEEAQGVRNEIERCGSFLSAYLTLYCCSRQS